MTATTQLEPIPQRSIQDEDESVRIAVRALGDMRNAALLQPSSAQPPSISCAHILSFPSPVCPVRSDLPSLAFQPTPALSISSSSNSPTLTSPTLGSDEPEMDDEEADFVARVSTFPVVSSALRAYEQSKASSRVVKVRCRFSCAISKRRLIGYLVRRGDDGIFREEYITTCHRPITGHFSRRVCLPAARPGTFRSCSLCSFLFFSIVASSPLSLCLSLFRLSVSSGATVQARDDHQALMQMDAVRAENANVNVDAAVGSRLYRYVT